MKEVEKATAGLIKELTKKLKDSSERLDHYEDLAELHLTEKPTIRLPEFIKRSITYYRTEIKEVRQSIQGLVK